MQCGSRVKHVRVRQVSVQHATNNNTHKLMHIEIHARCMGHVMRSMSCTRRHQRQQLYTLQLCAASNTLDKLERRGKQAGE
jgi:hypothetical protein